MRFHVEALLPIDCRTYVVERDSAAFRSLLARSLNLGQYEFVESWRESGVKHVKLATKPDFSAWVPKSARSVLPTEELAFYDIIEYNPSLLQSPPYALRVRSVVPFVGDRADIRCVLTIQEAGPNRTLQRLEGHIRIKAFGVGSIAERMVNGSLENTYKRLPEVVQRWVEFREEVLRQPGGQEALLMGRPSLSSVQWIKEEVRARMRTPSLTPSEISLQRPSLATSAPAPSRQPSATASTAVLGERPEGEEPLAPPTPAQQPPPLAGLPRRSTRRSRHRDIMSSSAELPPAPGSLPAEQVPAQPEEQREQHLPAAGQLPPAAASSSQPAAAAAAQAHVQVLSRKSGPSQVPPAGGSWLRPSHLPRLHLWMLTLRNTVSMGSWPRAAAALTARQQSRYSMCQGQRSPCHWRVPAPLRLMTTIAG